MKNKIFDLKQSYDNDYESFCTENCIRQILEYYGVGYAPFFINAALKLTLAQSEADGFGYALLFDKKTVLPDYEDKIKVNMPYDKSTQEVWEENKTKVKEGVPIITSVDMFYFDYTSHYNKYHSNHQIILCGYSDDEEHATIIDHYQWVYKGNIALKRFKEARASLCPKDDSPYSGYPINNTWIEADRHGWNADPRELLCNTVSMSLEQYFTINPYYKDNNYFGIGALKKILEIVTQYKEVYVEDGVEFFRQLRLAFLFIYARIKLFKHYMQMSLSIITADILTKINEQAIQEVEEWELLIRLVIKEIYSKERVFYIKMINSLKRIIEIEERRYDMLRRLNNILL